MKSKQFKLPGGIILRVNNTAPLFCKVCKTPTRMYVSTSGLAAKGMFPASEVWTYQGIKKRRKTEDRAFCSILCFRTYVFSELFTLNIKSNVEAEKLLEGTSASPIKSIKIGMLEYTLEHISDNLVLLSTFPSRVCNYTLMNIVSKKEIEDLLKMFEEHNGNL